MTVPALISGLSRAALISGVALPTLITRVSPAAVISWLPLVSLLPGLASVSWRSLWARRSLRGDRWRRAHGTADKR